MNEEIKSAYETWLAQPNMPADLADELHSIAGDEDAITDRFYRELEFGTGGLRGVIGAGTNRMNIYNIRKATPPACPRRLPSATTAASRAMCSPARLPPSSPPTASRPTSTPGWSPPRP